MKKIQAPKGTNDFYGERAEAFERILEVAAEVFREFGFRPLYTPVFERTELFVRNLGETSDVVQKEMYTFPDKKGRSMTLRPEGTAPVVRALVQHTLLQAGVDRVHYAAPMFRYEQPQDGRYRQHTQIGCEAFGDPSPQVDVEVIHCLVTILARLGLDDLSVKLHSVGDPESRERYNQALRERLAGKEDRLNEACRARLERNPMRILDDKDPGTHALLDEVEMPPFLDFLGDEDAAHFEAVKAGLDALGVEYRIDPKLVRGFDYYTRTAFEVVSGQLGAQDAVGGGGRYDRMVQELGGPPTPGVGFGSGVERIMLILERRQQAPPPRAEPGLAYVVVGDDEARGEALALVAELRAAGVPARAHWKGGKLGKQFQAADRCRAAFALVLGKREREAGAVQVKDLASGKQEAVPRAEVVRRLAGGASGAENALGRDKVLARLQAKAAGPEGSDS